MLKFHYISKRNNSLISPFIFTESDLILIKDCLLQRVGQNLKKFRKYSEEDLNSLRVVEKINLFMGVKQV